MSASVTLNALRRFLRASGCIEERVLRDPDSPRIHIQFRCDMKAGRVCGAVLGADRSEARIPANLLEKIGRQLAPCLGRRWVNQIPEEDPFG